MSCLCSSNFAPLPLGSGVMMLCDWKAPPPNKPGHAKPGGGGLGALGQNSVVKKKSPRAAVSALWLTYPIAWDPYQPVGGSESLSSGSGGRNLIVGAVSVR